MRALLLAALYLAVAVPVYAFPIQVNIEISHSNASALSGGYEPMFGSGTFIFDTDVWPSLEGDQGVDGGTQLLRSLSIDYAGRHWGFEDVSSVRLYWHELPTGMLTLWTPNGFGPFHSWYLLGEDLRLDGQDTGSFGMLGGEEVVINWTLEPASLAEPPIAALFVIGLAGLVIPAGRLRRIPLLLRA